MTIENQRQRAQLVDQWQTVLSSIQRQRAGAYGRVMPIDFDSAMEQLYGLAVPSDPVPPAGMPGADESNGCQPLPVDPSAAEVYQPRPDNRTRDLQRVCIDPTTGEAWLTDMVCGPCSKWCRPRVTSLLACGAGFIVAWAVIDGLERLHMLVLRNQIKIH